MELFKKETLFGLKSISQPQVADNRIFYLENSVNEKENSYESIIYSIDIVTNERQVWGNQAKRVSRLMVSPDKKWLSFVAGNKETKKTEIVVMPLAGGSAKAIASEKNIQTYEWSEDSQSIYYQWSFDPMHSDDEEQGVDDQSKSWPKAIRTSKLGYQADGAGFLPDMHSELKKVQVATGETQVVFESAEDFYFGGLTKAETAFYYTAEQSPTDEFHWKSAVYRYDFSTKQTTSFAEIVPDGSYHFVALSPDDTQLIVLGNDQRYGFVTLDELLVVNLATKDVHSFTEGLDISIGDSISSDFQQNNQGIDLLWQSDAEFLIPVTEHGKTQLYQGSLATKKLVKVVDQAMHVTDVAVKSPSELVITRSDLTTPSVLARLSLDTGEQTVLYDPNAAYLAEYTLAQPETFWYKGADDWDVQGWYYPPTSDESIDRHPAILYIHGGPQVCYGETFFHEMQVHAANGYGVILLNPRGGQSYGQDFVRAILGDYGHKDYEDLMLGVDAVLSNHPEIDESLVHVVGGSYGGFMTNWVVGHTTRFRSAITQRSISNWISFYGTSDIGPIFVKNQLLRDIDELADLWRLSPLAYANQVETPTFVMHSENDLRCPLEQGQQFYTALKRKGVDTKFMLFPQSSHGLSRNGLPNLRMDRYTAIEEWFFAHE